VVRNALIASCIGTALPYLPILLILQWHSLTGIFEHRDNISVFYKTPGISLEAKHVLV